MNIVFTGLVEASRRTSMLVKKPSKGSTSQITSTPRQPWKRESKKVDVAMVEEPKKAAKGRKIEREKWYPSPLFCLDGRAIQHP